MMVAWTSVAVSESGSDLTQGWQDLLRDRRDMREERCHGRLLGFGLSNWVNGTVSTGVERSREVCLGHMKSKMAIR